MPNSFSIDPAIRSVAVSGAAGNLGGKLLAHLAGVEGLSRLVGLDLRVPDLLPPGVEWVSCDLTDWNDRRWREAVESVDALVHLAACNPYPEASWTDAAVSLEMTLNLANAAVEAGRPRRFVFASSNHVMGRYKDDPLWSSLAEGGLGTHLPPGVGTVWNTGERIIDGTPYSSAKFMGERICHASAARAAGRLSFVCLRIGWCQPGANLPATLSASGTPTLSEVRPTGIGAEAWQRADAWFRGMWLSNRDFTQLTEKAIRADGRAWPDGCIVVNGMSANRGMKWSLAEGRGWLDYRPLDDVFAGRPREGA